MKKILSVLCFVFLVALLFCDNVFAGMGDQPQIPTTWQGSADGYASKSSSDSSVVNDGKKCGEDVLCFSGNGLFIKLLKYNYESKSVEVIGKPIFLYNGGMINKASVIRVEASEAPRIDNNVWETVNSCLKKIELEYGYEEIEIYEKKDITICAGDGYSCTTFSGSTFPGLTMIKDGSLPDITSGTVPDYIKSTLIEKYAGSPEKIYSSFKISGLDFSELDKYYLAFEVAGRVKGSVENTYKQEETKYSITFPFGVGRYVCSVNKSDEAFWIETQFRRCKTTKKGNCTLDAATNSYSCSVNSDTYSSNFACSLGCKTTKYGDWNQDGCFWPDFQFNSTLYTRTYNGKSRIVTARSTSKAKLIAGLVTAKSENVCNSDDNGAIANCVKHEVLDKNNNPTGEYEYYIGPTLETALVGTSSKNKYKLWDMNWEAPDKSDANNGYAVGVSYWWLPSLPGMSCSDVCSGKSGDGLLKCAENYCDNLVGYDDRSNTQKLKASCITGLCGYEYVPTSCSNSNPYLNAEGLNNNVSSTSVCNRVGGGSTLSEDNIRTIVTCSSDKTDIINPSDAASSEDVFDAKTYINIACKETSSFQFTDLSNKKIVAGQGLDYFAKLKGEKECTVFFDLNTWKFAYASYHSEDMVALKDGSVVSSRQLLLNMLDYYNKSVTTNGNTPIGIEMDGNELDITWNDLKYNINKVSVTTSVTEIVNNIKTTSSSYTLVALEKDIDNKLDVTENEEILTFANLVNKKVYLNKYVQSSFANVKYGFEKYCVTNDGIATVYKAPENGVCYVKGSGASSEQILGKNVYYTNLNATPNKDFNSDVIARGEQHAVGTTVATVLNDSGQPYLIDNESCPYEIDGSSLQCNISITPNAGTEMHGNDIYVKGSVTAKLHIIEELGEDDFVDGRGLSLSESALLNGEEEILVSISNKKNGIEEINITGVVQSSKGKEAICKKKIYIIDPECNVSCSVSQYEGSSSIYEIIASGNPNSYYTALSTDMTWVKLSQDIIKKKYLVRIDDRNRETVIYGIVKGNGCYGVCWDAPEIQNLPNCTSSCKPAETGKIKEHCENHWEEDINNYDSVDDCITRCSNACPSDRRDLNKITSYCRSNYLNLGFSKESNCINYCYYCPECSSDYIYRPVNNYNPFPNSYDSNTLGFNYPTGDRIIGSNWVGKSSYIKADDYDTTSVTGVQKNQNVEYVIELTPNDIREIRRDTESYNNTTQGNDAYLDYVYMDGVDKNGKYYSKFINETLREKFTIIAGEVVG